MDEDRMRELIRDAVAAAVGAGAGGDVQRQIDQAIQAAADANAAANAATAAAQAATVARAGAGVAPTFVLNPANTGTTAWDFTSAMGLKIYMAAVTPLEPLYDGSEGLLNVFMRKVSLRAEMFGFPMILRISDSAGNIVGGWGLHCNSI